MDVTYPKALLRLIGDTTVHRYRVLAWVLLHFPHLVSRLAAALRRAEYSRKEREKYETTLVVKFERVWVRRLCAWGYSVTNDKTPDREQASKQKHGKTSGGLWY